MRHFRRMPSVARFYIFMVSKSSCGLSIWSFLKNLFLKMPPWKRFLTGMQQCTLYSCLKTAFLNMYRRFWFLSVQRPCSAMRLLALKRKVPPKEEAFYLCFVESSFQENHMVLKLLTFPNAGGAPFINAIQPSWKQQFRTDCIFLLRFQASVAISSPKSRTAKFETWKTLTSSTETDINH